MEPMHKVYSVEVTTLSPLHIGTGDVLQKGFDYVVHNGRTWVVHADALLDEVWGPKPDPRLLGRPAEELLEALGKDAFNPQARYFRYVLPGAPRAEARGAEVREQLKDPWDRPYLPGSSVKGALRTVLAAVGWQKRGLHLDPSRLRDNRSWAAQSLERTLFGKDPNHDLLRALQVADSDPVGPEHLILVNAQVAVKDRLASPIELEAVRPGTAFHLTLTFDGYLLRQEVREKLGWRDEVQWLWQVVSLARRHALLRLRREMQYWNGVKGAQRILDFLVKLYKEAEALAENEAFLQIGWGGGWDSKTFGTGNLQRDPNAFEAVVRRYNLARGRTSRKPGDPFPRSRRVVVVTGRGRESGKLITVPDQPLGWVRIRVKEG
jgi:CRISPR-associated protein Csm5